MAASALSAKLASDPEVRELLARLARKYVWWKSPATALERPERIVSQVMELGDYADVQNLAKSLGDDCLREILRSATAGQFSPPSWTYWHYRLGTPASRPVPPLPKRRLP